MEEFEIINSDASLQLGTGGSEGSRRMGEESSRGKPNLGSGVCTASTTKQVLKLQYGQLVQGEAHSLGGEGGRVEGGEGVEGEVAGGVHGPVWKTLAPWCPGCHCWAVMIPA